MTTDGRVSRATLTSQVEDAVRLDIIHGVLPPGQRLRAADLSRKYGVSATPLREALQRLAAQRLIDWDPRLGAAVAEVSLPELRDIYWLREKLETLALSRSIELGDEDWEARLAQAWERLRKARRPSAGSRQAGAIEWPEAHRQFHEALLAACDSTWLRRFTRTLSQHSERYRVLSAHIGTRDSREEHEELMRTAVARQTEPAIQALRRHLTSTVDVIDKELSERRS